MNFSRAKIVFFRSLWTLFLCDIIMMPDENFTKDAPGSGIDSSHIGTKDQDF
jgi:hypothetical protein